MPNSPRKPSPRRQQNPPPSPDDLFVDDSKASAAVEPPHEEWSFDEPAAAPRARGGNRSPQPIPPASTHNFESNPGSEAPAAPPPPEPAPSPPPASSPPREAVVHDPFEIDDDLPPPSAPPRSPTESRPTIADLEGAPASPSEDSGASTGTPRRRRDNLGLATSAAVLIALLALFAGIIYTNRPTSTTVNSHRDPILPMTGKVVTLPEVTSGWRARQAGDRVSTVDVTLPAPSRLQPALLPQVQFTCQPSAGGTGFLRFIFLDPDGKISGDVRVLKWSGGTLDPLSSGATLTNAHSGVVYGSLGFMDRPGFIAYASGNSQRWSVEISESADYNAKEEGWTRLGTFDIRNITGP